MYYIMLMDFEKRIHVVWTRVFVPKNVCIIYTYIRVSQYIHSYYIIFLYIQSTKYNTK